MKPHFSDAQGTFVHAVPGAAPAIGEPFEPTMKPLIGAHADVRFAKFRPAENVDTPVLMAQKDRTGIEVEDGFPVAKVPEMEFDSLAALVSTVNLAGKRERWIWKICSIFLDPIDVAAGAIATEVPEVQREHLEEQMRMDALGSFWSREILAEDVKASLKRATTPEEKALAYLTANDIPTACTVLAESRNFKLAMLASQLPGTDSSRALMLNQLASWRNRNDWAEMSDAVRALYSIMAGKVCNVDDTRGTVENRTQGFNICERFGFSWRQSFALRLFYGGSHSAEGAVKAYGRDLAAGLESVIPEM